MTPERAPRAYRHEEHALIVFLILFFIAIVGFSFQSPFDARLFPLVIGGAGIILMLAISVEQVGWGAGATTALPHDDAAANASWSRFLAALLCAPLFALAFWLFGFVPAAAAAMLLIPVVMGYRRYKRLAAIAVITVAVLAFVAPRLLNVALPPGLITEWLSEYVRGS